MANQFQRALLGCYTGVDLLPIDAANHAEVDAAVRAHETGDTLFDFLWLELADVTDPDDACQRLDRAERDVMTVRHAFEDHEFKTADGTAATRDPVKALQEISALRSEAVFATSHKACDIADAALGKVQPAPGTHVFWFEGNEGDSVNGMSPSEGWWWKRGDAEGGPFSTPAQALADAEGHG